MASGDGEPEVTTPGKRRPRTVFVPLFVVAIVIAAGFYAFIYTYNRLPRSFEEDPRYEHSFLLTIEADQFAEFAVICPVPVNSTGSVYSGFMDEVEILSGDPECALVVTNRGYGLQVSGVGPTELRWDGDWGRGEEDFYLNMSMTNAPCSWDYEAPDGGFSAQISSDSQLQIGLYYTALSLRNVGPAFISGHGPHFVLRHQLYGIGWESLSLEYGWVLLN